MTSSPFRGGNQGLGGSLFLYLGTLLCGLMLFALPVYWLNSGTRIENPGLAAYDPPPGALMVRKPDPYTLQLANLKHDDVVDPAQLAAINAKAKKSSRPRRTATTTADAQREQTRIAAQPQPRNFFFGLF